MERHSLAKAVNAGSSPVVDAKFDTSRLTMLRVPNSKRVSRKSNGGA